ncbi:SNO glutamine amidotransferase [Russula earlei]|uniref:SNO glutamine amidotransferase n=1 Tax=Russula earlei TaxID=71964 RepID=A0ACC0UNU6_9AGAM|nr:SNO glutamine amidotransferase [Russula earlei]
MQDTQLAADLVIGILGASIKHRCRRSQAGNLTWTRRPHTAMQGAFAEHQAMLQKLSAKGRRRVEVVQVRTPEELRRCDGLIIPGGESTTIALLARLSGMMEPLREFVGAKPVWGTCAGAILLAQAVSNPKRGGQELLHGVSVEITRNGWGSQVESFEAPLEVSGLRNAEVPFTGVFIRAPVIAELIEAAHDSQQQPIKVLSRISRSLLPSSLPDGGGDVSAAQTVVALRQGRHLLTTFHPELTDDDRFHEYFVQECVIPSLASRRNG